MCLAINIATLAIEPLSLTRFVRVNTLLVNNQRKVEKASFSVCDIQYCVP